MTYKLRYLLLPRLTTLAKYLLLVASVSSSYASTYEIQLLDNFTYTRDTTTYRSFTGHQYANTKGDTVGTLLNSGGDAHAYLWTQDGTRIDLGTLGGRYSAVSAINNFGQVIGRSETSNGEEHAFLWTREDGMKDLGTLGGDWSSANAINDHGQVVGNSTIPNGEIRAILWNPSRGAVNLDYASRSSSSGWQLATTRGIDDSGRILGECVNNQGQTELLLLTPMDENRALADATQSSYRALFDPDAPCPFEGKYKGTWKLWYGPSGPWSLVVDAMCTILGNTVNEYGAPRSFTGSVDTDGHLTLEIPPDGFGDGQINTRGKVSAIAYTDGDKVTITGHLAVPIPKIVGLSQPFGKPGESVTISGKNFGDTPIEVRFGKANAEIVGWSNDQIIVVIPEFVTSSKGTAAAIRVRSASGKMSKARSFRVFTNPRPLLESLSERTGAPGQTLVITGRYFRDSSGSVTLGRLPVQIVDWRDDLITLVVPELRVGTRGKIVLARVHSESGLSSTKIKFKILPVSSINIQTTQHPI